MAVMLSSSHLRSECLKVQFSGPYSFYINDLEKDIKFANLLGKRMVKLFIDFFFGTLAKMTPRRTKKNIPLSINIFENVRSRMLR